MTADTQASLAIVNAPIPALAYNGRLAELPAGAYPVVEIDDAGPSIVYVTGPDDTVFGLDPTLDGVTLAAAGDPFNHPEMPPEALAGFVVGECGHRVAGSEFRAGLRSCERCPA